MGLCWNQLVGKLLLACLLALVVYTVMFLSPLQAQASARGVDSNVLMKTETGDAVSQPPPPAPGPKATELLQKIFAQSTPAPKAGSTTELIQSIFAEKQPKQTSAPPPPPGARKKISTTDLQALIGSSSTPAKGIDPNLLARAEAGDPASEARVAYAYGFGVGVPEDLAQRNIWYRKAAAAYRKAAEKGDANAQAYLGWAYFTGMGVPGDEAQAAAWYRKAAEQGNTDAQVGLANLYYDLSTPQDYAEAAAWYRKAAEKSDIEAELSLAVLYRFGRGVPQDYAQAAAWFRKAAEQGNADAQASLGMIYRYGQGVPQDYELSAFWYNKAANNKYASTSVSEEANEALEAFAAMDRNRKEQLFRINVMVLGSLAVFVALAFLTIRYRQKWISYLKKLVPHTKRTKQLAVVLPVASWCCVCFLYQVLDPTLMRHPINAAVTAFLFSMPALIFGGVLLWWLSLGGAKSSEER